MNERKYYVVKITIEDTHDTQLIEKYSTLKAAAMAYGEIINGTLAYDSVKVCNVMVVDDYFNPIEGLHYRYERSDVTPGE